MKFLSRTAEKVFQAALNRIPSGATSCKIGDADGGFMPLCVEKIGANKFGDIYSFAHYYEQNGDLMRDPDVTMLRTTKAGTFFPLSYRQDGLGINDECVIFEEDGSMKYSKKRQASLVSFCGTWARNLKQQQNLSA
jgi:hypothetical protein